jgi:hypothetical protein
MEEELKTESEQRKLANLKPFKPGQSGNPKGRPRGKRDFKTDFEIAAREVAKALGKGENPEQVYIELLKKGIASGLKGNYNFWKDIAERIYGKEVERIEQEVNMNLIDDEKFNTLLQRILERKNGQ